MGLLDALLGGGQGREEQQAFLQRFEQGPPWEGYSDQEVLKRYGTVAGQASPDEYRQAAAEAFSRMTPEQRIEFGRMLQQRARDRRANVGDLEHSGISDFQDAQRLASLTSRVHEQPGLLRSILGGGDQPQGQQAQGEQAGLLGSPLAKAALAGIAAMAIKKVLGARTSSAGAGPQTSTQGGTAGLAPGTIPSPPPAQDMPGTTARQTTSAAEGTTGGTTERWHQVVAGESLSKLAAKYYGDGRQWMKIFEANRNILTDPDLIKVGQRLRIP
jgi:nucleoid-associated protein YgaU